MVMLSHYALFCGLVFLSLIQFVTSHAAITYPAARNNPTVSGGWCPWCQGSQQFCADISDIKKCKPQIPCWGASGDSVSPDKFNYIKDVKDPAGKHWIDQNGGQAGYKPTWCTGKNYTINFYNYADHNGAYRWESQLAESGSETEEGFKNFTSWVSINNDANTDYYLIDGTTPIPLGECPSRAGVPWNFTVPHCRDKTFAKVNITIPSDLPAGNTVIRWRWYGAMTTDQVRVIGPENSLFINCLDVVISNASQCVDM